MRGTGRRRRRPLLTDGQFLVVWAFLVPLAVAVFGRRWLAGPAAPSWSPLVPPDAGAR